MEKVYKLSFFLNVMNLSWKLKAGGYRWSCNDIKHLSLKNWVINLITSTPCTRGHIVSLLENLIQISNYWLDYVWHHRNLCHGLHRIRVFIYRSMLTLFFLHRKHPSVIKFHTQLELQRHRELLQKSIYVWWQLLHYLIHLWQNYE